MGIEPTAQAWEAWVLPLYDARRALDSSRVARCRQIARGCGGYLEGRALAGQCTQAAQSRDQQPYGRGQWHRGERSIELYIGEAPVAEAIVVRSRTSGDHR